MPSAADSVVADAGFNRLRECRHGRLLFNVNDQYIGRSLDLYGEFSEGETELFARVLAAGDVVVEVGANIGAHTAWFGRAVGPGGGVVAFEPQRVVFQTLCANVALNGLANVHCFQQAVGAQAGSIVVPLLDPAAPNNFGGLELTHAFPAGDRIPLVRLDDLGLPRCKLLKVDVEGMELAVLQGAAGTIGRLQPVLYVENDRPHLAEALVRFIESLGYTCYWHRPPLFNPNNFYGNPHNVFGNVVSINMFCVPKQVTVVGLPRVEA